MKNSYLKTAIETALDDSLVMYGSAVKALGVDGAGFGRVGGHLVVFGDGVKRDLAGDYFVDDTYLGPTDGNGAMACFHHTLPIKGAEGLRDHRFAALKTSRDDVGIWAETVLDLADKYERRVYGAAMAGKLGWSSGSAPHLVRRENGVEAGKITQWPIVEGSLTPTPCEPLARARPIKSLPDAGDGVFDISPEMEAKVDAEIKAAQAGQYGSDGDAMYADPGLQADKRPRYPLARDGKLDQERIRAAWDYIHHTHDADEYSPEELTVIRHRIGEAADRAGISLEAAGAAVAGKVMCEGIDADGGALTAIAEKRKMVQRKMVELRLSGLRH